MQKEQLKARVCRATRRYVDLYDSSNNLLRGTAVDAVDALCVGDVVDYKNIDDNEIVVTLLHPRSNILKRSSASKTKLLAANIDHLFIVTAPGIICRPQTIDRVLIAASKQKIPCTLIWNKADLLEEFDKSKELRNAYIAAGYQIITTCAIKQDGIGELRAFLEKENFEHVVLTGVSGVGKSSIINSLFGSEYAKTQEISLKTGHGRQTTSEAFSYVYQFRPSLNLLLSDLPGVQQWGLAHLEESDIRNAYPEFQQLAKDCRFNNCSHLEEPECALLKQLEVTPNLATRYSSYKQIVLEHRQMHY